MKKGKLFGNRGWHHRSASATAALTAAALAVAALGTTTTAASAAPAKYNFVLIPGTVTDPFYITMGIGAKAEAAKLGISLLSRAPPRGTQRSKCRSSTRRWQRTRALFFYRAVRRRGPLQADRCLREGRHPGRQR